MILYQSDTISESTYHRVYTAGFDSARTSLVRFIVYSKKILFCLDLFNNGIKLCPIALILTEYTHYPTEVCSTHCTYVLCNTHSLYNKS